MSEEQAPAGPEADPLACLSEMARTSMSMYCFPPSLRSR